MNGNISVLDPTKVPDWDKRLYGFKDFSPFHTSGWARALIEAYGFTPLYFTRLDNGSIKSVVPLMEVRSLVTGARGVCLPFTDLSPALLEDPAEAGEFLSMIRSYGLKRGWRRIEFRDGFKDAHSSYSSYLHHETDIGKSDDELLRSFRDSTGRNIKKAAISCNLRTKVERSAEAMDEFYRLNCLSRKRKGLPPQPRSFFRSLQKSVISRGKGFVSLACKDGAVLSASVFLSSGQKAVYKYGASLKGADETRASYLIMWEAIRRLRDDGVVSLSFGRTERTNAGLLQLKSGWGAKAEPLYYYRYDLRKMCFVTGKEAVSPSYRPFKVLPMPVLRALGALLYRHTG
ncbi:MAG: GNAT family N-acetyltransferase [Deltaproteobacteria bacterium]|nr:GNAT family N-acetyltransferase [Deltaproteobacteria bacterium]